MTGLVRARYTLEFKQEAVRLVWGGQTVSSVAKTLGLSDQTLHNWLKAELAKTRMERDILKNRRGTRPPVGIETVVRYPGCGRERPSTFWWRVTP